MSKNWDYTQPTGTWHQSMWDWMNHAYLTHIGSAHEWEPIGKPPQEAFEKWPLNWLSTAITGEKVDPHA